jgi:hypothetical protein
MLFVLLHEMAHVAITQMGLPVLGKMEDAADTFAALRLIRVGSDFSPRVLTDAAEGWFMPDRRDGKRRMRWPIMTSTASISSAPTRLCA